MVYLATGVDPADAALSCQTTTEGRTVPDSLNHELALPESDICSAAISFVYDVSPEFVAHHCVRGYLFARDLAGAKGLSPEADYDDELLFLSCMLHDLGATEYGNGDQRFEVDGADAAASFLRPGFADLVHASWPRHDLGYALAWIIARQVDNNPVKGPPLSFPHHVHHLCQSQAAPLTWFDLVRLAGWNDQPQTSTDSVDFRS
ncbi:HD domain-containing protein [Mycolicibacterium sp. CBM1]